MICAIAKRVAKDILEFAPRGIHSISDQGYRTRAPSLFVTLPPGHPSDIFSLLIFDRRQKSAL